MGNLYKILHGFCEGYFGRDDWEDKIIILEGETWIVCKYLRKDTLVCLNFDSAIEKQECIDKWSKKNNTYEND